MLTVNVSGFEGDGAGAVVPAVHHWPRAAAAPCPHPGSRQGQLLLWGLSPRPLVCPPSFQNTAPRSPPTLKAVLFTGMLSSLLKENED